MSTEHLLPLVVALPLGVAFLIPLASLIWEKFAEILAVVTTAVLVLLTIKMLGTEPVIYTVGGWHPPFGICLVGDPLSHLFLLIIIVVSFLIIRIWI